jgi:hypothetical protein
LQECLRAEFSVLARTLGAELFDRFTFDYLRNYPSRSYTLNRLGENFPRYLAETRPDSESPPGTRESWPDFIIDLAILERAFSEVFDGPGVEGSALPDMEQRSSMTEERLLAMSFQPVPCLRLLAFRYPVVQYFQAQRNEGNPDLPDSAATFLVMNRRDYVVRFHELERQPYEVLRAMTDGQSLAQSIHGAPVSTSMALQWLCEWLAKGFLVAVKNN